MIILFIFLVVLYWLAEGITEGYSWASVSERRSNILIHSNGGTNGLLDYHAWRLLENIGIWGTVVLAMFLGTSAFWPGIGAWLLGVCFYDLSLNYVASGNLFKEAGWKWHILGYNVPWLTGTWNLVIGAIGMLIVVSTI